MNNMIIRQALMAYNLRYYELAELLGVSEATLGRKLRKELPEEDQRTVAEVIEEARHGKNI